MGAAFLSVGNISIKTLLFKNWLSW